MRQLGVSANTLNKQISKHTSLDGFISTPTVCIVFPVYNPPNDWWKHSLKYCQQLIADEPLYQWQFHFVNDGSSQADVFPTENALHTEGYQSINSSLFFHPYPKNKGKGFAIRYGLQQINIAADAYMHCDWDFPFGAYLCLQALYQLEESDVVLADRGQEYLSHLPPFRQKITKTQRKLNRYLLKLKATDTQAGFKAFNAKGKTAFLNTTINGFLFDTEFVRLSERKQLTISTLQANCRHNLQFKNFRLTVLAKEVLNLLTLIVK